MSARSEKKNQIFQISCRRSSCSGSQKRSDRIRSRERRNRKILQMFSSSSVNFFSTRKNWNKIVRFLFGEKKMVLINGEIHSSYPVRFQWPAVTVPVRNVFNNGLDEIIISWSNSQSINEAEIESYQVFFLPSRFLNFQSAAFSFLAQDTDLRFQGRTINKFWANWRRLSTTLDKKSRRRSLLLRFRSSPEKLTESSAIKTDGISMWKCCQRAFSRLSLRRPKTSRRFNRDRTNSHPDSRQVNRMSICVFSTRKCGRSP